jgi:diguanylate cyclase (GGDEF)-like protein
LGKHHETKERWRAGIAVRLYALALFPVVIALAAAGILIGQARQQTQEAGLIGDSVPRLAARLHLSGAVMEEAGATEIGIGTSSLGAAAGDLLPVKNVVGSLPAARRQVDGDLDAISRWDPSLVARYRPQLEAARSLSDRPGVTTEASAGRYHSLEAVVLADLISSDDELIGRVGDLSSRVAVIAGVQTLSSLNAALYYRHLQFDTLGQLMVGSVLPRTVLIGNLAAATAMYKQAADQLAISKDQQVGRDWAALVGGSSTRNVDATFAELTSRGNVDPAALLRNLLATTQAATALARTVTSLTDHEQASLTSLSGSVRADATRTMRTTALIALLVLVVACLFALRVTRSIRNPLTALERSARSLTSEGTAVQTISAQGPRETRTVIAAFNDLLANLRLVEAKSLALADLDLTNPALETRLPGRIGTAMDASLRALSDSVGERTRLAQQLAYDATHDALTGLANRQAAMSWLDDAFLELRMESTHLAVIFVDLDGFKLVNDTYGHRVGDELLVRVSELMQATIGSDEMVARLGGDEFLLVTRPQNADEAVLLGQRIVSALTQTFTLGSVSASVGASVGVALSGKEVTSTGELVARADLALYRAKQNGRARVQLFDEALHREMTSRTERESALQATLARGGDELGLLYQAMVDPQGRVKAVEALVRWARPGIGQLEAGEFVPLAEATELIVGLDRWVLASAAQQAAAWRLDPALADLAVSVNVSGKYLLSGGLPEYVASVLAEAALPASSLILEISETVLLTETRGTTRELDALRAMGVRVAVHDFGAGITSVSELRCLPVDIVKIGRSFIQELTEPTGRTLVGLFADLGHAVGLEVVAQGVETQEQRAALATVGADLLQGHLIGKPVPAEQVCGHSVIPVPRSDLARDCRPASAER